MVDRGVNKMRNMKNVEGLRRKIIKMKESIIRRLGEEVIKKRKERIGGMKMDKKEDFDVRRMRWKGGWKKGCKGKWRFKKRFNDN